MDDSSERYTYDRCVLVWTWYEGESNHEKHKVHETSSCDTVKTSENLRDSVGRNDSDASKSGESIEFVDIANVRFRHGSRKEKSSVLIHESNNLIKSK